MQRVCEVDKHLKRKGTQEPKKGPSHAKHGISGEPCEAGWLKAQSLWDGVPVSREPKLCRDLQVSGTLAELAREVCTEDKESTSASSTFISLHKQRHTHYN